MDLSDIGIPLSSIGIIFPGIFRSSDDEDDEKKLNAKLIGTNTNTKDNNIIR